MSGRPRLRVPREEDAHRTKRCNDCGIEKLWDEFQLDPKCKPLAYCIPCFRQRGKNWAKANPEKTRRQDRKTQLRRRFGLSLEDYERMLAEQGGGCAICGRLDSGRPYAKNFSIDHNHTTGEIRGLLCNKCNIAIGLFEESEAAMLAAIAYLRDR